MLKVRTYKQHTMETCGISCLLMVLDAFGKGYPTLAKENELHTHYSAKVTKGTLGASIACAMRSKWLDVELCHASPNALENTCTDEDGVERPYFPPEVFEQILSKHEEDIRKAQSLCGPASLDRGSFRMQNGVPITAETLKAELAKERLVMVQCFIPGDDDAHGKLMHWVLLYGWEDGLFLFVDPLPNGGKRRLPEAELLELMQTPFGPCALSVGAQPPPAPPEGENISSF